MAQALSHYARGLLSESIEGTRSPNALEEFSEAARLDPGSERLQARVASSALLRGDAERSIAALRKLCALNPGSVAARVDLAAVYQYNSQPDLAEQVYREAIALDPGRTLTYWEATRSMLGAESDKAALSFLEAGLAAANEPNVLLTYLDGVAVQFARAHMFDRAIPCLELLSRHAENRRVLFMLAYAYARNERLEEAISTFEALQSCSEKDGEGVLSAAFYLLHANICESAGKRAEAETIMEECVRHHPDASEALNFLAYCWAERGERLDMAEEYVLRALKDQPDNGAYVDTLGWVYYQKKQYDMALRELQKASSLLVDDPTVIDHLGDAMNALGDTEKALTQWKRSILIDPEQRHVRDKLEVHGVDVDVLLREAGKARGTDDGTANEE